ncbi:hypothetical protein [Dyella sp. 20L07]|uniref:hypothetical protein n=1 Tax=Dyella sp. 20L07 TaxID=3384240 RepID=UPI003D2BD1F1
MLGKVKSLLLVMALCAPFGGVWAGGWFAWQSDDSLRWSSEGQYLRLSTAKAGGVNVIDLTPGSLWGLAKGDVILAADGKPLHNVSDLMIRLRAHDNSPMPLTLRRNNAEQTVMLAAQARGRLLHDEPPPAPAAPPAPPAAPVPPSG